MVVEDGAQSIGAEYKGRRAQSLGDMGCISFFPSKNLGAFGDAGMVLTGDEGLARKLAALRVHGAPRKYFHEWVGVNSRLDSLQAAVLRVKLQYLDAETAGRQKNAGRYRANLAGAGLPIGLPQPASYQTRHVYNQFVICAARRDQLKAYLQENGVGSEIYYPLSLHQQACFRDLGYREGDFPESEKAAREVLALPVHSALTEQDVDYVCQQIRAFYA
jgi:dTDP-4-amino-4,6-dideoxygalactose transaminase